MEQILVTLLTPMFVWIAGAAATAVNKHLPDWIVTTFVIPAMSALGTYIATLTFPGAPWYVMFLLGLGGTFIREFLKNLGRAIVALLNNTPVPRMNADKAKA